MAGQGECRNQRARRSLHRIASHLIAEPVKAVSIGSAHIHYEVFGDLQGPVVIFVHGAGGNAAVWWRNIPYLTKRGYSAIVYDTRCFGISSKRTQAMDGFEGGMTLARDAVAILDEVKVKHAVFVCQSLGGWTGIHAAVHFPERVTALVMCSTCAGIALPEDLGKLWMDHFQRMEKLEGLLRTGQSPMSLGGRALGIQFQEQNPELAVWYNINSSFNEAGTMLSALRQVAPASVDQVRSISCPTLMISSDYDPFFQKELIWEVAKLMGPSGGQVKHFPGIGHSVYFENPDGFNYALMDFLRSVAPVADAGWREWV